MVQPDAPVQIISVKANKDNLLATITVKNMTDRPIEDFDIGWSIFRPANCATTGPAQLQQMGGGGRSAHASGPCRLTERLNRHRLVVHDVENGIQFCNLHHIVNPLREVEQFQLSLVHPHPD